MDLILSSSTLTTLGPIFAAGGLAPDTIPGLGWFTNSIFVAILVTLAVLLFTRMATKRMELIPGPKQNLVELVVEFLFNQTEAIVGKQVAPRVFPLLCMIWVFVLLVNWSGLVPGVGSVGFAGGKEYMAAPITIKADAGAKPKSDDYGEAYAGDSYDGQEGPEDSKSKDKSQAKDKDYVPAFSPLLRPPSADLNFTLALACVFMVVWAWVTIKEVGLWGFLVHTFGPKGGVQGFMKYPLIVVFFMVGVIELVSIAARPVSLSLRLFGNVYAGETLLYSMMHMGKNFGLTGIPYFISSVILPLPFYFLELLVGILQATVFALLCAVFIKLSTTHDEEH